jgi:hypothetical protein
MILLFPMQVIGLEHWRAWGMTEQPFMSWLDDYCTAAALSAGMGAVLDRRRPRALGERPGTEVFRPSVTPAIALRDDRRAQTAEEPTIQVTIGRVEIRATVAPTPVRKTTARPPAMSLDEYLKRRNEASR